MIFQMLVLKKRLYSWMCLKMGYFKHTHKFGPQQIGLIFYGENTPSGFSGAPKFWRPFLGPIVGYFFFRVEKNIGRLPQEWDVFASSLFGSESDLDTHSSLTTWRMGSQDGWFSGDRI